MDKNKCVSIITELDDKYIIKCETMFGNCYMTSVSKMKLQYVINYNKSQGIDSTIEDTLSAINTKLYRYHVGKNPDEDTINKYLRLLSREKAYN